MRHNTAIFFILLHNFSNKLPYGQTSRLAGRQRVHMLNKHLPGQHIHGKNNFARIVFIIVNAGR